MCVCVRVPACVFDRDRYTERERERETKCQRENTCHFFLWFIFCQYVRAYQENIFYMHFFTHNTGSTMAFDILLFDADFNSTVAYISSPTDFKHLCLLLKLNTYLSPIAFKRSSSSNCNPYPEISASVKIKDFVYLKKYISCTN